MASSRINILKVGNFESSNLSVSSIKPLGNQGGKQVPVTYKFPEGSSLVTIQTPWMTSYGINEWVDDKKPDMPPKLSVNLSFGGIESDDKIKELYEFLEVLDNWAIDTIHKNSGAWLKVKSAPRDTIAFNYSPSFKIPTDKESGEPTGKPAFMKVKLAQREGKYTATFFNKSKEVIEDDDVKGVFTLGSKVRALIQCSGFWIVSGKFGLTWNLKQLMVDPPTRIGKEYAFCDEEEESPVETITPIAVAVAAKDSTELSSPEIKEIPKAIELPDSDNETQETSPQVVKKVVRKVVSKK
jgi:hypothetical protein